MRSVQIRDTFRTFFQSHGHRSVPSSSLIPDDPTLLLTTAGMVQFKPYFLGTATPPTTRLTSAQKCVRTVDIDNIGRTDRHATFFEMLGNFSFGDSCPGGRPPGTPDAGLAAREASGGCDAGYGKDQVVVWAYELLTEQFGLDPDRLWTTVYLDDDETVELWRDRGIPAERIQRLGMADNYWDAGVGGPCGPCSEIFYDRGPRYGRAGGPAVDTDRYLEVWNLVFMRHIRGPGGTDDDFPIAGDLPRPCIESGLGLERLAVVLQGVDNVHETDLVAPTLHRLADLAGVDYPSPTANRSLRIVVDHVRACTFLLADGVLPTSDGRGYVVRRLLRRAVHHGRRLGLTTPFLADLAGTVVDRHGESWPELTSQRALVEQALTYEEEAFDRTLRQGSRLLDGAITQARERAGSALPAETAFELHDTYGFPLDLTLEIADEAGLEVDADRVAELMDEQRRRARDAGLTRRSGSGSGPYPELAGRHGRTRFVGYDALVSDGTVLALVNGDREVAAAGEGDRVEVVLDRTPLYAEAGGQVGDTGLVRTSDGAELRVTDTTYGTTGLHVHAVEVIRGEVRVGDHVETIVDRGRREATTRSHSATHVLHAMLRRTLGEHARQHGSLVAPGRLRFDFSHFAAVPDDDLATVEEDVNTHLLADPQVRVWETSIDEALAAGATALFGEKYGEVVRVVDIGDFSRELCGGTHVGHGSQVGPVRIVAEESVGSGLRRVEAVTGADALTYADHEHRLLQEVGALLGARPDQVVPRLRQRLSALADAERELAELRRREIATLARGLADRRVDVGAGWTVVERVDVGDLRILAGQVLEHCPRERPGGVVLGSASGGTAQLVLQVNERFGGRCGRPRDLLAEAGRIVGGGSGGSGPVAFAGGRDTTRLDAALAEARSQLATCLSSPGVDRPPPVRS